LIEKDWKIYQTKQLNAGLPVSYNGDSRDITAQCPEFEPLPMSDETKTTILITLLVVIGGEFILLLFGGLVYCAIKKA
jgi:hypothetical protein